MQEAPVHPRTQAGRREEAVDRLLSSALELLATRGFDGFTLADVGEAAGFSRGLPAHYFKRKDVLLAEAVKYAVATYNATLPVLPLTDRSATRISDLIRHHARMGDNAGSRALNILVAEASHRETLQPVIAELTRQGLDLLRSELEAARKNGAIRSEIDVDQYARMIFAFLRGQMSFSIIDPQYDSVAASELFIAALEKDLSTS